MKYETFHINKSFLYWQTLIILTWPIQKNSISAYHYNNCENKSNNMIIDVSLYVVRNEVLKYLGSISISAFSNSNFVFRARILTLLIIFLSMYLSYSSNWHERLYIHLNHDFFKTLISTFLVITRTGPCQNKLIHVWRITSIRMNPANSRYNNWISIWTFIVLYSFKTNKPTTTARNRCWFTDAMINIRYSTSSTVTIYRFPTSRRYEIPLQPKSSTQFL